MSLHLNPPFAQTLRDLGRPAVGMWVCSGSPVAAEICAGSGMDWLLVDAEHGVVSLETVQELLQVAAAYPVQSVVRLPSLDVVAIKQFLDAGAQNLLIPMVDDAAAAELAVAATRYPPAGVRGVGSALSRSARWGGVAGYLTEAEKYISLCVQIESATAVENAAEICAVEGLAGVFVGPSDLAASMGLLGQQNHPDVVAAVKRVIGTARAAGLPVGVNAFDPQIAQDYLDAGADFILVAADVQLLALESKKLAARFISGYSADSQPAGGGTDVGY
ncbi:HpcH/HpaI aldolase family protein [Rothia sp. CCM 9417]|uniref:HpcH/HpaI aldolase family protein n=1 Tax=Rothia sp. CCM 9417 TaxID=3402657 RepID=UPI003AE1E3C0